MIIIKTANGTEFINEAETKWITHNKDNAEVLFAHPLESHQKIFQVESVLYTNKENTEYEDNGLALTAALKDRQFYGQLQQSTEEFAEQLYRSRSELEIFIIQREELFTKDYEKAFVKRIREKIKERPGTCHQELTQFQDMSFFNEIRKNADQYGKEVTKWVESMTARLCELDAEISKKCREIYELETENTSLKYKIKRMTLRGLWERIINKDIKSV